MPTSRIKQKDSFQTIFGKSHLKEPFNRAAALYLQQIEFGSESVDEINSEASDDDEHGLGIKTQTHKAAVHSLLDYSKVIEHMLFVP